MADETYEQNLMRAAVAYLQLQTGMQAAREMYGKIYFALGIGEKVVIDKTVQDMMASNFLALTQEYFGKQTTGVGFRAGMADDPAKTESTPQQASNRP